MADVKHPSEFTKEEIDRMLAVLDGVKISPAWERRAAVTRFQLNVWNKLFPWMNTPVLHYITSFWIGLIDDGPYQMLKPRWGGITFGWLNDGRPSLWHTWRQLTHNHSDPYCGIYYPRWGPKSLKQAQEWEAEWKKEGRA